MHHPAPTSYGTSAILAAACHAALSLAALTLPLLAFPAAAAPAGAARQGWTLHASAEPGAPVVPGRLVVKFRAPMDGHTKTSPHLRALLGDALDSARPLLRRRVTAPLPGGVERLFTVEVSADADLRRLARKLAALPEVEYAEPVVVQQLVGEDDHLAAVPNDPQYVTQQAYLQVMQVEQAWNIAKGADTSPIVCVIDGGTDWLHEDLQANMWTNAGEVPGNFLDDDSNGFVDDVHGWDFREDNGDPRGNWAATPSNSNHGTHTGGLLAAVTNNGVGIACASWNPRLMAVNASGTQDGGIAFGFEGILYAADNGARIVSLSWGSTDASQAEQDVIDYATSQGVLVIAAAGNNNSRTPFFPAAYRNVIAVANVWGQGPSTDQRYGTGSASNYGGWVDVAAAGVSVYSTFDFNLTNQYGSSTGTSMSAPVAAAVAALIQSLHPTWTPLEVGEQLRISCNNINALNPGFEDLLGKGRVNAFRAVSLSSPSVRLTNWTLHDADGNGELNQGENVTVSVEAHNYLADATALVLTLTSPSPHVTITDGNQSLGSLARGATTNVANAFAFTVSPSAPPGAKFDLRLDIAGTSYTDFQWIPIVLEPVVKTHDVNNLVLSLTSTGNLGWIGFPGGLQGEEGQGFRFQGGPNLLFEGALLLGTGPAALSDAARSTVERSDFLPANNQPPRRLTPGPVADQEILAPFVDTANQTTPLGVRVDLHSEAYAAPPNDDFVFVGFKVTNTTAGAFTGLRVGLFLDWDIDEAGYDQNSAAWDAERRLGYAWNGSVSGLPYVGVMTFGGPVPSYSAVRNDGTGQPVNVYNGLTKGEKWTLLSGTGIQSVGPTDISNVLSTGPFTLQPGDSLRVWFALLAGDNLADLQLNADRALAVYGDTIQTAIGEMPPQTTESPALRFHLGPAMPNPFNPGTRLTLQVDRPRQIQLAIYDIRGRLVRLLADRVQPAGLVQVGWDGRDQEGAAVGSGVYMLTLRSERVIQVQRLVLTR